MKKYFSIIIFILFSTISYSQRDSIEKEILKYENSKSVIISKGRSLLLDKFMQNDFNKTREIKNYLMNDVDSKDYLALYPVEHWLILYWTKEYDELIGSISNLDSTEAVLLSKKIRPQNDLLFDKIRSRSRESRSILIGMVNSSGLSNHYKDFLVLYLDYLLADKDSPYITQDYLNEKADDFLKKYPGSEFEKRIRKYIRYVQIPSKWSFDFEFFSGYGVFTERLPDYFKNNVPVGVGFGVYYKRLAVYLRDYIGFSKTVKDISYSTGTWPEGSQVRVYLPEASLGYVVTDNKIFKLAPFAGISGIDIGPTEYDTNNNTDLKKAELNFTTAYSFGLNVDFKIRGPKIPVAPAGKEQAYLFIRIRYAYNISQFEKKYEGFNGNMHYLTIGVGGLGRKLKRDY